jgi:ABC-type lipoprotein release transport system permease subunit
MLYQVSPLDPLVFVVGPVTLAIAATIAAWIPARRATRVAPVTALRTE